MEKLHKYCLSVLLIIVCSNISGQVSNESVKNIDCKKFYEIYSQFLGYQCETSQEICLKERSIRNFAINHKQKAVDAIGNFIFGKQQNSSYNKKSVNFSEKDIHHKILENFKKQSKQSDFAENTYLKSKTAKIRNKDDLDLKNKT